MEALDEPDAGSDEYSPQNQGTQDAPEKDAMLVLLWNGKIVEYHQENKQIVDTQRQLHHVSGDEFQGGLTTLPEVQNGGEDGSLRDVHQAPTHGFAKADG